ncbi:MAG TPA: WbqC family protein [Magnetospirillaceae bacterium]|nr:WbqC family protein [Magnetospirillaceae bacterium]
MILSAHQPVYLPGIILFNKIALSDCFMFLGHAQLVKQSWHMRNRIRQGDSEVFLTIPVKTAGRLGQAIDNTEFADDFWKRKHIETIRQAYRKRPYFDAYFGPIEALLSADWPSLGALNKALIRHFLALLDIRTPILESTDHDPQGHKTELLIEMTKAAGANAFLSNEGARVYVQEEQMRISGVGHHWQIFEHPTYPQGRTPFMPHLSIIDLLFNAGPEAGPIVRASGHVSPAWKG